MMSDLDLKYKIKRLKRIAPSKDYAVFSRSLLLSHKTNAAHSLEAAEDASFAKQLGALKSIAPDANYALSTRLSILESNKISPRRFMQMFSIQRIIPQFMSYSLGVGLAALLIGLVITGGYRYLNPVSPLASADNEALVNEAKTISSDIDIHLQTIGYYASAADKTNVALNDASASNLRYANSSVIENESRKISPNDPRNNQKIDDLLNQAIF